MSKLKISSAILISLFFLFLAFLSPFLLFQKAGASEDFEIALEINERSNDLDSFLMVQNNSAIANNSHLLDAVNYRAKLDTVYVFVTAYSSDPAETNGNPFITASGSFVHWGTVATNFLPFGTKIQIPEIFGDEIFVVKDRMHRSKRYVVDVWHPSKEQAINFGAHLTYIKIL